MKKTETVYRCDAPNCDVARPADGDGDVIGIQIKALAVDNGGGADVEAFACRLTHIGPALRAVLDSAATAEN